MQETSRRPLFAHVYFSSPGVVGSLSIVDAAQLMQTCTRRVFRSLIPHMVRSVGRSEFVHCAIGDGEVVLEPGVDGDSFWGVDAFEIGYPALAWRVTVPVNWPIGIENYVPGGPREIWPTIIRAARKGKGHSNDCVTVTLGLLRAAGVRLNPRIATPGRLYDALRGLGCEMQEMSIG